jgi:hypothetical protein
MGEKPASCGAEGEEPWLTPFMKIAKPNYRIQKVPVGFLPQRRLFGMFWRRFGSPVRTHNDACAAIRWRILAGPSR